MATQVNSWRTWWIGLERIKPDQPNTKAIPRIEHRVLFQVQNCSFIDHNNRDTGWLRRENYKDHREPNCQQNEQEMKKILISDQGLITSAFYSDISGKGITNSQRTLPHQHKIGNKTPPTEVSLHTATRTLRILHLSPTHQQLITSQLLWPLHKELISYFLCLIDLLNLQFLHWLFVCFPNILQI